MPLTTALLFYLQKILGRNNFIREHKILISIQILPDGFPSGGKPKSERPRCEFQSYK